MSFAQPWALFVAAGVAAVAIALHFLARRRPRPMALPTARFVPTRTVRATSRSTRPSDLLLLLLRVLAVLLVGAAFARPVLSPERRPLARVVVLDLSASVRSSAAARESAARYLRAGDLLVVFDSAARLVAGDARDSLAGLHGDDAPGSLSAALVAATRGASLLRGHADSVELVLISPFAAEEWDAATGGIRALWNGHARLVRTEIAERPERARAVDARAEGDDPVRAAVLLQGGSATAAAAEVSTTSTTATDVRIVRGLVSEADSAWARSDGHVLVRWPAAAPDDWPRRNRTDTVGAVIVGNAVLVAGFARAALPPAGDGRVVARWVDGVPAATERVLGEGCVRDVAISFPARGDLALGESARRLVSALTVPCGGARDLAPLSESRLAILRGDEVQAGARTLAPPEVERSGASSWLLLSAALLLLAELFVRRAPATEPGSIS